MIEAIRMLIELFMSRCKDQRSMKVLLQMTAARDSWPEGHALFRSMREKTLRAERDGDKVAECQYPFEEVCAQALYNLSGAPAPFDADHRTG